MLPIRRAEELLATLAGVVSAKIVVSNGGIVEAIHVLTTAEYTPKQTVRNIESALIAHLGMRVDHRKISVAMSTDRPVVPATPAMATPAIPFPIPVVASVADQRPSSSGSSATPTVGSVGEIGASPGVARERVVTLDIERADSSPSVVSRLPSADSDQASSRRIYFDDVEVRASRTQGITCRVTLRKDDASYTGDAEGQEGSRARVELAARAAIKAMVQAEHGARMLVLDGVKVVEAFDREFVFVGLAAQVGRERVLLSGSCEVRESPEQASVLAVLDATNRWIAHGR